MKTQIVSLLGASLLFCGCKDETADDRLNIASLQPYTNIQPGTIVLVQMRGDGQDYTHIDTLGHPRQFDAMFGGEYIFEGITYGSVGLRRTNDTKTLYYSGKMVQSIKPKMDTKILEKK